MRKDIHFDNKKVTYTLRKSKCARRLRLAVYCDGSIVLTTPFYLKESVAERFMREKSGWLFSKIAFFKQFKAKPIARHNKDDYLKYKEDAYALATERVEYFNKMYKFKYNKINIKNQKTRWGSCSKKGNLNFNYKIALLPKRLSDYIIIHELCHLKEFNHSRSFWNLVSEICPSYKDMRHELNKFGLSLNENAM